MRLSALSYGVNFADLLRRAAIYVDKITTTDNGLDVVAVQIPSEV